MGSELSRWDEAARRASETFRLERKPGRPPKYTKEQLELAAQIYSEAYAGGLSYPTKTVAVRLGISRNVAAKLIMKCRQEGLLEATSRRKAGGASVGQRTAANHLDDQPSRDGT